MHQTQTSWGKDASLGLKNLVGMWFFCIYSIVYAGFIGINVFYPELMGVDVGSLNVAIVYGFGLIIFALLLALAYNHICSKAEEMFAQKDAAA